MINPKAYLSSLVKSVKKPRLQAGPITRDPRYVIILFVGIIVLIISTVQAINPGSLDSLERPIFQYVNSLPEFLLPLFYALTQLGSFLAVVIWGAVAYGLGRMRALVTLFGSALTTWIIAKSMKVAVGRGRPGDVLDSIQSLSSEVFSGNGFPSGHATMVATCVTVIYFLVERQYRKYLLFIVFLVGLSRVYLGAHFPLDVVGGWALGAMVASIFCLVIGTRRAPINYSKLKNKLDDISINDVSIRQMNVDARGSTPLVATTKDNKQYFLKVFGSQEYAADWIFKSFRLIKFKSKANEEAYLSSKRNIELESLAAHWAASVGVRTPKQIAMFQLDSRWVLVHEMIDAKPLSHYKKIQNKTLVDIWRQVKALHDGNISHRDLRADNVMIDKNGKAYLIDFGFSEVAPNKIRKHIDIAQLVMSLSLIAGVGRSVDTAKKTLGGDALLGALPYLQHSAFSSEISKQVKANGSILEDLKQEIKDVLNLKADVKEARLERINLKKTVAAVMIAAAIYIIVPQLSEFKGALTSLGDIEIGWALLAVMASALTYLAAGGVIYSLIELPVSLTKSVAVQFASSFVSKLVPGGVGSATLNLRFLKKAGASTGQAAGVLATERAVGALSLGLIFLILVIINGDDTSAISLEFDSVHLFITLALIIIVGAILYFSKKARDRFVTFMSDAYEQLHKLTKTPVTLLTALLAATLITVFYVLCVYFSLKSVGQSLGIIEAFVVYATASLAKSVSPTPGGLGALEVAMAVALRSFGIAAPAAFAAVVVYRLATYWIPLPFGLIAYNYLQKKKDL